MLNRLNPDKFPRRQIFYLWFWFMSYVSIDFMYFRLHKHWPVNKQGKITSLRNKGSYDAQ